MRGERERERKQKEEGDIDNKQGKRWEGGKKKDVHLRLIFSTPVAMIFSITSRRRRVSLFVFSGEKYA